MVLPIYAYGHEVLKKVGSEIGPDHEDLNELIANMWETMYHAKGVGLAAPQVGQAIRLFIVDSLQIEKDEHGHKGIKKVFINAQILEENGEEWPYEEGCLSIPDITADVLRQASIKIQYQNEHFETFVEEYGEMNARIIQHEYDHIEGKLFIEKINPLKRRLLGRKLENIRKGKIDPDYRMRFGR